MNTFAKIHVNGYALINVNGVQWTVCTGSNRLGVFDSRENAAAYAFALPDPRSKQNPSGLRNG